MAEITLEQFTAFLKEKRDVTVAFRPSSLQNHSATYRYQLSADGRVFEVYTYNRKAYHVCHIDDGRSMADNFLMSLRSAFRMEATCSEDIKKFKGIL